MRRYNPLPQMLSTNEAAAHLGVTVGWVRYLVAVGDLPAHSVGKRYVLSLHDLDSYKEHRTAKRAWRTIHNAERAAR